MPIINYKDTAVELKQPDSVLDALNAAGLSIPFSCRAGLCHSCMLQSDSQPPSSAQNGLSQNQISQNLFLACCCFPESDMTVNTMGFSNKSPSTVDKKIMLNKTVLALFIQVDHSWFPGQYLTLWKDDTQGRSYSIASRCEATKIIELHIKKHEYGQVSSWLHDDVKLGDNIMVSKPMGNCFYNIDDIDKPLLLVATGTGLAPLLGIAREALANNHNAPIYLYSGAGEPDDLYYRSELTELTNKHPKFFYIPSVRRNADKTSGVLDQDIVDLVKNRHSDMKGWKAFLCGNESMIKQVQRHCFFQGVTVDDILVDAFIINKPT